MLQWIAAAWLGGLFVGAQWQPSLAPLLTAFALAGSLLVSTSRADLGARLWLVPLSVMAFCSGLAVEHGASEPCSIRGEARLIARVESVRHGTGEARLRLRVLEGRFVANHRALGAGLELHAKVIDIWAPPPGSVVVLEADLAPRTELRNPSPHPRLLPERGTACWARWRDRDAMQLLEVSPWVAAIDAARARVRAKMDGALPQEVAGVARALVLGDGAALDYSLRQTIAAVGLAHLFAVSGLHVALVSGALVRSLHWLVRGAAVGVDPRRLAAAIGVPLTLLHAFFAGGSPSAWRAAITAALTWCLVVVGRRPSAGCVTAAAALLLSVPEPAMALRPAFLLSIVATSAILSTTRVSRTERWSRLRTAAILSARTLVATAPMVWWWFGGVPLVGWVTNILVLPLGSGLVIPLAHLFALSVPFPELTEPIGTALTVAVNALLALCDVFEPFSVTRRLPPLDVTQGLIVLAACLLLLLGRSWRSRLAVLAFSSLLWLGANQALVAREQPRGLLRVSFVDVGQGDASLIDFPDGRLALVDTGQGGRHPAVRELTSLLAARRRSRIDLMIITHGHPDHYGALPQLLDAVEISEIWINGQLLTEELDGAMSRLMTEAMARGAKLRFVPELCGSNETFGGAELEVLWPCPRYDPGLGLNDNSIVFRLEFGRRAFLFTGDVERDAERLLVDSKRIEPADVLKVAHHGSKTSSSAELVAAVGAGIAVISSGAGNRYGHPSPEVIARLRSANAIVWRTDVRGGVILSTDGENLELSR